MSLVRAAALRQFRLAVLCAVLPVAGLLAPAAAEDRSGPETNKPQETTPGEYRIGAEDLLYIAVWKNDTLSRQVPVRPDGMISLPLLNDVRAEGMTPMELRDDLARRLSKFMPAPEVSVIVQEVHSPKASVLGEVVHPGRYDLKGPTTVLDLLAVAGGLTEFASKSRIVVLRDGGPRVKHIRFNYDKAMEDGDANFVLRPGDIVLVR
jgi:polysaccharide export outer membrane protein